MTEVEKGSFEKVLGYNVDDLAVRLRGIVEEFELNMVALSAMVGVSRYTLQEFMTDDRRKRSYHAKTLIKINAFIKRREELCGANKECQ